MPEITSYPESFPCWVDVSTDDLDTTIRFYCDLFGWEARAVPEQKAQGYTHFLLDGKSVAGCGPKLNPKLPGAWMTYINVGDIDKACHLTTEAGGRVLSKPVQVADRGNAAVISDAVGATVGLWQPDQMIGSQVIMENNAWAWSELQTHETSRAAEFYERVFGWQHQTQGEPPLDYTQWMVNGDAFGGMMTIAPDVPVGTPSFWFPYFAAESCDALTRRAQRLGASVQIPNMQIPHGYFSILSDPKDTMFGLLTME